VNAGDQIVGGDVFEETANSLVNYGEQQQRLVKLNDQARESARASSIARARYREGVADFLALLDAKRTQLSGGGRCSPGRIAGLTSVVAVYKSRGGITTEEAHESQSSAAQ
jgi:multidrug efflux system outer membrane protein